MTMINCEFINNQNINESNSLVELIQHMDPDFEDEVNIIEHSKYYDEDEFKSMTECINGTLHILNLNCGGLSAKFNKLNLFLANCNHSRFPISVITLQDTHFNSSTDFNYYNIPGYTMINDPARINSFGGVTIYLHNSFSYTRLPADTFKQNSPVYESMFLEIYKFDSKFKKYIIGNVYSRPSEYVDDLNTFINEFTEYALIIYI